MSSARLFQNKTFQAALARNRRDQELREQDERSRLASSPSSAAAPPRPVTTPLAAGSASIQRRNTPQLTKESSVAAPDALAARPQHSANSRPLPLATFASNPVTRHPSPGDPVAKRQRTHLNSPSREYSASDSPVTDCKPQSTPSTHMRPSGSQLHRAEHPCSPYPHPATPLNRESVSRTAASTPLQNLSPPTPVRNVPRAPTASTWLHKSPAPHFQSPVHSTQTYASRGLVALKLSPPFYSMKNSHTSSLPPPNEPTPMCSASSVQRGFPFVVSAGFQNDGNTCYLRYALTRPLYHRSRITRRCSAALVILLGQATFVTEVLSTETDMHSQSFSAHTRAQLVSEYSAASDDHRSDFVRDFPCLAEVPTHSIRFCCIPFCCTPSC